MPYTEQHASALADVAEAGADVTFTAVSPGTYNATTDTWSSPTTTTVTGQAIEVAGDPEQYRDLELIQSNPATLFFVPTTIGQEPPKESTASWAGSTKTVKAVKPLRPGGTTIAARVVLA